MALLEAHHLHVDLHTRRGTAPALRDISFTLERGDTLGLIGESGCGKTLTALALIGLAPGSARVSGSLKLDGAQLIGLNERGWQRVRGARIAMIFQEPMTALNPVHRVGAQIAEPLMLHRRLPAAQARARAIALLDRVGIADAARRANNYPHQFSGGQRQRIMIAMALACKPDVLVADEPTSALDVAVQTQILALIRELVAERGMALILISHDLGLVAQHTRRMLVMYGGAVLERGTADEIFGQPAHPYTRGLLAARPSLAQRLLARRGERLPTIAGAVPDVHHLPPGCPFAGRCGLTEDPCFSDIPPTQALSDTHRFSCRRADILLRASTPTACNDR
ncbi:MAG: ABC transporter ATP-binding protein [Burkholderiaceae bacterium]|jgi:peptide/nickel transport system ATP-binding protein|nr:ABC transporter ATP-binding protein [Burkholderiaceae bacterium]